MNFADYLNSFGQTASNIYGVLQTGKQPAPAASAPVSSGTNWSQYLPWGIGAAVLLVIVLVVARK